MRNVDILFSSLTYIVSVFSVANLIVVFVVFFGTKKLSLA